MLVAGCGGGSGDSAQAVFAQAQRGLTRIHSGEVTGHAKVLSPIKLDRDFSVPASRVPWSAIDLGKLTRNPRRLKCEAGLECARADLDVQGALKAFGPALPALPVDPSQIHDATLEVAVGKHDHAPRYLKITANAAAGGLLGDVEVEVILNLPPS